MSRLVVGSVVFQGFKPGKELKYNWMSDSKSRLDGWNSTNNLASLDSINTDQDPSPEERGWNEVFSATKGQNGNIKTILWEAEDGIYVVTTHRTGVKTSSHGGILFDVRQVGDELEYTEFAGLDNQNQGAEDAADYILFEGGCYGANADSGNDTAWIDADIDVSGWPEDELEVAREAADNDFRFYFQLTSEGDRAK